MSPVFTLKKAFKRPVTRWQASQRSPTATRQPRTSVAVPSSKFAKEG
jgi:hypothetical protein